MKTNMHDPMSTYPKSFSRKSTMLRVLFGAVFFIAIVQIGSATATIVNEDDQPPVLRSATISSSAVEVTEPALLENAVVRLTISNVDDDGKVMGNCTGTVFEPTRIITAAHCVSVEGKPHLTIGADAGYHRDATGNIVTPYGTCAVGTATFPLAYGHTVGSDVAILDIVSCADENGAQQESLARLGDRTGVIPLATGAQFKQPASVAYGYPGVDGNGELTEGRRLFRLPVTGCGDSGRIATNVGENVRVFCEYLAEGASGGPVIAVTAEGPRIVTLVARKETWETVRNAQAMSGPDLAQLVANR